MHDACPGRFAMRARGVRGKGVRARSHIHASATATSDLDDEATRKQTTPRPTAQRNTLAP
eukprot:scaffold19461_cov107-Isochrysis_galbana.AAC.1